jgi:hypothetical protein
MWSKASISPSLRSKTGEAQPFGLCPIVHISTGNTVDVLSMPPVMRRTGCKLFGITLPVGKNDTSCFADLAVWHCRSGRILSAGTLAIAPKVRTVGLRARGDFPCPGAIVIHKA